MSKHPETHETGFLLLRPQSELHPPDCTCANFLRFEAVPAQLSSCRGQDGGIPRRRQSECLSRRAAAAAAACCDGRVHEGRRTGQSRAVSQYNCRRFSPGREQCDLRATSQGVGSHVVLEASTSSSKDRYVIHPSLLLSRTPKRHQLGRRAALDVVVRPTCFHPRHTFVQTLRHICAIRAAAREHVERCSEQCSLTACLACSSARVRRAMLVCLGCSARHYLGSWSGTQRPGSHLAHLERWRSLHYVLLLRPPSMACNSTVPRVATSRIRRRSQSRAQQSGSVMRILHTNVYQSI